MINAIYCAAIFKIYSHMDTNEWWNFEKKVEYLLVNFWSSVNVINIQPLVSAMCKY